MAVLVTRRGRRVCLGLYATAAVLMTPWAADWLLNRLGIRSSAYLGAPSIRIAHHRRKAHQ